LSSLFLSPLCCKYLTVYGIHTLILSNTDEAFVGRVNGVLNPMFMGMKVVGMGPAPGVLKIPFWSLFRGRHFIFDWMKTEN
jgi:hypothetical protein